QLNASNLDPLFEATDDFEEALTTSRKNASKRLNSLNDLSSIMFRRIVIIVLVVVALVGNDQASTLYEGITNGLFPKKLRTLQRQSSVALQPLVLAVTSVALQFFIDNVTRLILHIKFLNSLSVIYSLLILVMGSAVHSI
ncbi:MAG: hypothetical protein EZS28_048026, partial [Streblomastix strix]